MVFMARIMRARRPAARPRPAGLPSAAVARSAGWLEQEHDALYDENIEGGHAGAADNEQVAFMKALSYTFLARQLGLK